MRRTSSFDRIPLLAALATAVVSCTDGPLPTAATTGAEGPSLAVVAVRPMKISTRFQPVGDVVPPPAPCLQMFNAVSEGTATHLGDFEGVSTTCVLDVVAPDPDPPFLPAGPGPYFTATFSNPSWVLTAANGDELWLESHDAVAVISLSDNSLRARGTHVIVGGTGRFAGATGELQTSSANDDGQGPDDGESEGWISFSAGRQHQ